MIGRSLPPSLIAASLPPLLYVDRDAEAGMVTTGLRDRFRVTLVNTVTEALAQVLRRHPAFVVAELSLPDGTGADVCRVAKRLELPATVLVMSAEPALVPEALAAGCDGVLLKPFAPNLLHARLGRLLRTRSDELRERTRRRHVALGPGLGRSAPLTSGTNQCWPDRCCPMCHHQGVTSFEFVSYRRAWYACPECRQVWIARRLEQL